MFGDYDKTLWLILAGDIDGREKIASFVRDIPADCFAQVRQMIENYKSTGKLQMSRVVRMMEDEVTRLSFDVHVYEDGDLFLALNKTCNSGMVTDTSFFSLTLSPFETLYNRSDIIPVGERVVGEINYCKSSRFSGDDSNKNEVLNFESEEKKINMSFSPIGFFVGVNTEYLNQQDDKSGTKKSKRRVSIRKIPDKLAPFDFRDLNRVYRLVKRKRPRRNKNSK